MDRDPRYRLGGGTRAVREHVSASATIRRLQARFDASRKYPLSDRVRHWSHTARNWVHFRSVVRPDHVTFLRLVSIYVDPRDERGRYLLKHRGITQSGVTGSWIAADRLLDPHLCLDIGANYGEVSLCVRHKDRRLWLFEPNPALLPFLARSAASHVDSSAISVEPMAVGDAAGRATLAVTEGWSGTSSLRATGSEPTRPVEVEVTTIDDFLASEDLSGTRLLFKIDVEGFEGQALAGMQATLQRCAGFAGIVEFDRSYLEEVDTGNARLTVERLLGYGSCAYVDEDDRLWSFADVEDLPAHTDIVVCSDPEVLAAIEIPPWARSR